MVVGEQKVALGTDAVIGAKLGQIDHIRGDERVGFRAAWPQDSLT